MQYSLAIIPAALAVFVQATPQAIKVAAAGPARITDIAAEATRVMHIMEEQSPTGSTNTAPVTVTGAPVTVATTVTAKVTAKTTKKTTKTTLKKTTKKAKTTTKKKINRRAVSTTTTTPITTTTTTTTSSSSSTTSAAGTCAPQPVYQPYYPAAGTDPTTFLKDATINNAAANAVTPSGFNWMWSNYMMSTNTRGFLGAYQLTSYNVSQCASICNSTDYCYSFNVFYERDPSVDPGASCSNPSPIASIRCTLWDSRLDIYTAVNYGQWRNSFAVLVAGSNGYARP